MGGLKVYTAAGAKKVTGGLGTGTASDITIVDVAGLFTATEVESALAELAAEEFGSPTVLGGGSFRRSITQGSQIWAYDDFGTFSGTQTSGVIGGLNVQASGTGALIRSAGTTIAQNHPGQVSLLTGTGTSGLAALYWGDNASVNGLTLNSGTMFFGCWVKIPTASDGSNTFRVRIGLTNDYSDNEPSDGIGFRYTDGVNGGKWESVKRVASAETATDTGVAPGTGWRKYVVTVTAAGAATLYIDNVQVATATGLDVTAVLMARIGIYKSAGVTARDIHLDAYYILQTISR